jgi:HEPN domain-containing protein
MAKDEKEWFRQADYDMGAAQTMFGGSQYIYAVFMCHLSMEKALKGLYFKKHGKQAPKTHNLWYLVEEIGLAIPETMAEFIVTLNRQCVVTRYPEDLRKIEKMYNKKNAKAVMEQSAEVLRWLREKL